MLPHTNTFNIRKIYANRFKKIKNNNKFFQSTFFVRVFPFIASSIYNAFNAIVCLNFV